MLKILKILLAIALISALLLFGAIVDFWMLLNGLSKLIYTFTVLFSIIVFFTGSYFVFKINSLKKENAGIRSLNKSIEKKFGQLGQERNRMAEVFLNLQEGVIVIDENERVSMINPRAKRLLGIKSKVAQGLPVRELCQAFGLKSLLPYFLSINGPERIKATLSNFAVELFSVPLIFDDKNLGRMIVMHDKTAERNLEKSRTDFILSSAHRLKTSAASIKWSLKMFLSGDFGKISKEQKNIMERLYEKNNSLIFLIESLVDAAKIEENALSYRKTWIDFEELVRFVVFGFQDKIKSKKIKVIFKKPLLKIPKIKLDKEKIESVVQNIFDNALKYTAPGGSIKIELDSAGKEIKMQVKDTGIGIPAEQQAQIFNKFFRASNANEGEFGGSGLGLFISKKIIEDHGGEIWFESQENKGSAFYFSIPIKNE